MKIVHLISGLGLGGAEKNLTEIVLSDTKNENIIISLTEANYFHKKIKKKIKVEFLDFKNGNFFVNLLRLVNLMIRHKPHVINSWMYHANLISIIFIFSKIKIIWNVRHSKLIDKESKKFKIYEKIHILFSYFVPKIIVFNSKKSKDHYLNLGVPLKKTIVIQNGIKLNLSSLHYKKKIIQ